MEQVDKNKNIWLELLRFCITGAVAALFDYLVCQLIILAMGGINNEVLITSLSTAGGFIIGVTINYLMSTFWVYQNVDKNTKTKSPMFIFWFVLLSIGGLIVSILAMIMCDLVVQQIFSYSIVDISLMELIKKYGISFLTQGQFWSYFISFCVKTLFGLVFNYFTRKYILYKKPKSEQTQ